MKNPVMRFTDQKKEVEYTLWRIDDEIRAKLYKGSPRIQPDYGSYSRFEQFLKEEGLDLSFAQMYVTLKSLSGESSQHFYSFKESFSFPFILRKEACRSPRYCSKGQI
jgi:hypothetical protein